MTIKWLRRVGRPFLAFTLAMAGLLSASAARAGPWLTPGDSALRSDIQILADAGRILSPTMVWPMAWGDIMDSLDESGEDWTAAETAALVRLKKRMQLETRTGYVRLNAHASVAENPIDIRSFEDTPREKGEFGIGLEYTGEWWATKVQGQWVSDPQDGDEWRADDSYLGIALGNWMLAAAVTDRWWGPGWQSSLILSSNARPIPAITLERNLTTPFETKWLSWLGHWDLMTFWGWLEEDRFVPNANLFGLRLDFRPVKSFQFSFSRTAQLCGDGRPCGLDTFFDMLVGNDNVGDDTTKEDEPGNQLAGIDMRFSHRVLNQPFALYMQWIGEDESGFFPTNWLVLGGGELSGHSDRLGTWRAYLEWTDTECNFRLYGSVRGDDDRRPGCAYNHPTYQTGYRYKGRPIGHSFDGDSSVFTLGGTLTGTAASQWVVSAAAGNLNRRSAKPSTTAENKTRYRAFSLTHRRPLWIGDLFTGVGYDYRKDTVTGAKIDDFQFFVEWGVSY